MKESDKVIFVEAKGQGGANPPELFFERPGAPPKVAQQFQETGIGPLDCGEPWLWLWENTAMDIYAAMALAEKNWVEYERLSAAAGGVGAWL